MTKSEGADGLAGSPLAPAVWDERDHEDAAPEGVPEGAGAPPEGAAGPPALPGAVAAAPAGAPEAPAASGVIIALSEVAAPAALAEAAELR